MKKLLVLSFFSLLTIYASAQNDAPVEQKYAEYFKIPRETLYTHLNKTSFIKGEDIWFKAYAYDRKNNLSSKATSNVYVSIYDAKGKQVKKKLFFAFNGAAQGNIPIDSTFVSGSYFLKTSTNWMKNFDEKEAYIQKIEIIDPQTIAENKEKTNTEYDFQFLPEGGHMISDTKNNIGFKMIDAQGKGAQVSGVVYDQDNNEIASFKSNALGLGKFTFKPESNRRYKATLTSEFGETFTKEFPVIKDQGISITVNNLRPDKVIITLHTNTSTLPTIAGKTFKLLLHRDGAIKSIPFTFDQQIRKIIPILRKDLYKGMNIITLFNDKKQPVLERLIFNDVGIRSKELALSKVNTAQDSIQYQIKNIGTTGNKEAVNLSISVLPLGTESYVPDHTIISAFYLKPYLKGTIEKPEYYFTNRDKKKKYELDILLLTQGWSKYSWDRIFNNPPKAVFKFENGITINGTINNLPPDVKNLFLQPTQKHASQFIALDGNKFTLKNFYPINGEEIRISYLDKKGGFKKPNAYINYSDVNFTFDTLGANEMTGTSRSSAGNDQNEREVSIPFDFFAKDAQVLDEVVVKTKVEKKKKKSPDDFSVNARVTEVTKDVYFKYPNITDFIQDNGYDVVLGDGVLLPLGEVIIQQRRLITLSGPSSPLVFVDNVPLSEFSMLSTIATSSVESISVDKTGLGYGSRGAAGVIKIYLRKTALFDTSFSSASSYKAKVTLGFQPVKEFYAPKYSSYSGETFKKFGLVHWEPQVLLTNNNPYSFKTINTNTKSLVFFIEGIAEDGSLISERKVIKSD